MFKKLSILLCSFTLVCSANLINFANAATPEKDWTFLVFLNGKNNLDSFGKMNINQMENIGSTDNVNVVVQWGSLANKKTQRLFVQKDKDKTKVTSPVVQDMGNGVDMGDWRTLVEFVRWGVANYPAKHYFINVWDHGSGWHAIQSQSAKKRGIEISPSDISWDDTTGSFMTTQQLGQAMAESAAIIGHKVDVYGSDACLMAMAEVAGEMKSAVDVFVGSQELEPGQGWPYDDLLARWNAKAGTSPAEVGRILTEVYVKAYTGGQYGRQEVTLSAYDLSKMEQFEAAVSALGRTLMGLDAPSRAKAVQSFRGSINFYYDDYRDLQDFMTLLEKANVESLKGATLFSDMKRAIGEFVIANAVTKDYARAGGVSIWMPGNLPAFNSYAERYAPLSFQAATDWSSTLRYVLQDAKP